MAISTDTRASEAVVDRLHASGFDDVWVIHLW